MHVLQHHCIPLSLMMPEAGCHRVCWTVQAAIQHHQDHVKQSSWVIWHQKQGLKAAVLQHHAHSVMRRGVVAMQCNCAAAFQSR